MPQVTPNGSIPDHFEKGSVFLVRIHSIEASRSLFIPGHRLEAFRDPLVLPWNLELLDDGGAALGTRVIPISGSDAWVFFQLFGRRVFIDQLMANDAKNFQAIDQAEGELGNAILRITAYDMGDFYDRNGLGAGDYLRFRMLDGEGRRFSIEGLRADSIDPAEIPRSYEAMAAGFKEAFKSLGLPGQLARTLREAMLRAPADLLLRPAASLSDYVNNGDLLEMQDYLGMGFLWEHIDDPEAFFAAHFRDFEGEGSTEKPVGRGRARSPTTDAPSLGPRAPAGRARPSTRKARPKSERIFIIEATVGYIEPPIRRLLSVPGNRTLGDLHGILQLSFGWMNSHLHGFVINEKVYSTPSEDDWEPVNDERKIRLDALGLRENSGFRYDYDFGDDWEHELLVVETKAAGPEDQDRVVCLEGSRAAPPEDSGGPPGYMELTRILAKKATSRKKEERELLAWADACYEPKKWDPERFEISETQSALDRLR